MNQEKKTVLVIDDDKNILALVTRTFQNTEFVVLKASDGGEGVKVAKELKPDVILLDITMPKYDGFTIGKVLKRNINTKNIPIIFLSGKKSKQDINLAINAGGADYIIKPFSPSDLITRIRRITGAKEANESIENAKETEISAKGEASLKGDNSRIQELYKNNVTRHKDVIVCSNISSSIVFDNCNIYSGLFANIVTEGIFKVVFDYENIKNIDGAGLALLASVHESLKSYGGGLRFILPDNKSIPQLSYVNINELFRGYSTEREAVESFQKSEPNEERIPDSNELNVCMSCTFVNDSDSRYCKYCGSVLIMGRGEKIIERLRKVISRRLIEETQTDDIQKINKSRNIDAEEVGISSEFKVELFADNYDLKYKSVRTIDKYFDTTSQIGIQMPSLDGKIMQLRPGLKLTLSSSREGSFSGFETEINRVDEENGFIYVHYSEDAKVIHSQKNFSIAPSLPIPIRFIIPTFNSSGKKMTGTILELSHVKMIVFTEESIAEDTCMAVNFTLPDGYPVTSSLIIARKRRERFMYDFFFVLIEEKERSKIIQYMYKRQIELAKFE